MRLVPPWEPPVPEELTESQREAAAHLALRGLAERDPELSAERVLSHRQGRVLAGLALVLVLGALLAGPLLVGRVVCGLLVVVYAAAVSYRIACLRRGMRRVDVTTVSDEDARAVPDHALPRYTVLVPAYREPTVIAQVLGHLEALDYPRDRLEVLLLLESDDPETLAAAQAARPGRHVRTLVVPPADTTTKPRACNYGLELATGDLVTIFDAEDEPEPLQLRKAAIAFARDPGVACLQARLSYHNAGTNLLTRWFTAEYVTWFRHLLPGLVALGSPLPLGGTSNHVRVSVLREVGGWDPYNVTEDADLGLRLARRGHRVGVLDSVTLEEANSDPINWVKQRSRWYKGYLQTWLVHMRHPRQVRRELGWRGLLGVNLFIGGTPALALLNPLFWGMTLLWFLAHPPVIEQLFSGPVFYVALAAWIGGNLATVYTGVLSIREAGRPELLLAALLVPGYWLMMALAAVKAFVQLVRNPSFWEKTAHGLDLPSAVHAPATPAPSVLRLDPSA